ncbi:MAG: hypothetical protein KGL18_18530 [Burkholderiales bacterium]|nr:hypothetical protein [Burkholderiales bacterium]MDE1927726.1 hypothetical protein [Burkholderiales bacterium]MDE2157715.1 hypothetical protein [Burkholderiales bacterium]MDE2504965.1 hypothetical protein [Burkholderiales bacterium]
MDANAAPLPIVPRRHHLTRLMAIWRSAGWPCRDAIELDLLAAGWARQAQTPEGHEIIRLTDAGIRLLAESRQRNQRAASPHDQLALRVAAHLSAAGRIVWRELSLRARVGAEAAMRVEEAPPPDAALWQDEPADAAASAASGAKGSWRMARPDVFSIRNTTVENYLQPMVHEIKVSRADLLSDLRHAAKRESYQWLSCETYYVFPAGVAEPQEIPAEFGVLVLDGPIDGGALVLARPAMHQPCQLPFCAWIALAKAHPVRLDPESAQRYLGEEAAVSDPIAADAAATGPLGPSSAA